MLATLCEIVGATMPRWAGEDSYTMLPVWMGAKEATRDHVVLQTYTGVLIIRDQHWKLILGTEGSGGHQTATPDWAPNFGGWDRIRDINVGQLYNLGKDPYERSNLFGQHPDIVARLRQRLEKVVLEDRSRPLD